MIVLKNSFADFNKQLVRFDGTHIEVGYSHPVRHARHRGDKPFPKIKIDSLMIQDTYGTDGIDGSKYYYFDMPQPAIELVKPTLLRGGSIYDTSQRVGIHIYDTSIWRAKIIPINTVRFHDTTTHHQ